MLSANTAATTLKSINDLFQAIANLCNKLLNVYTNI